MVNTSPPRPDSPPPAPDNGGDPLARLLFGQLKGRPVVDVVHVYRALQARFGNEPDDEERTWCTDALRLCREEQGSCSKPRYDSWWRSLDDRSEWPSSNVVRRVFGSWVDARAAVDTTGLFDASTRTLRRAATFTADGIVRSIQAWVDWLGTDALTRRLTRDDFLAWCRARRPDPAFAHLELPVNKHPIKRNLGGWVPALRHAGVLEQSERNASHVARTFAAMSDAQMAQLLVEAHAHWGRVPSQSDYSEGLRTGQLAVPGLVLPPVSAIVNRFGGWLAAWVRAGVLSELDAQRRRDCRSEAISDDFARRELNRAIDEHGTDISRSRYVTWRSLHIERHGKNAGTPPSDAWLRGRWGSFEKARDAAIAERGATP